MYDRYGDISKFITDPDKLEILYDEYVYISGENDYDIAIDLEGCYSTFDDLKAFMAFLSEHICEMDNIAQRFNRTKRIKSSGYVTLPSEPGYIRLDYSQSIEDNQNPSSKASKRFPYDLQVIYIEKPDFVTFDYWCTDENSQLDVVFEYKDGKFFLRKYGMLDLIPDDWDK